MANEMYFFLDAPVAHSAAYDAAGGSDLSSAATNGTVLYKRLSGCCSMQLKFLGCQLIANVTGGTAVVLTAAVRPVVGTGTVSAGTRVIGTISIPSGTIAGDVVFGSFGDDDININPGEEVVVELTTKSTAAGTGYVCAGYSLGMVGPGSGGSATVPRVTAKPYGKGVAQGAATGQVKLVTSGTTGN